jgi:2-methylisocitrate lyase-like PEP mutase family enzyme
MADCARVYAGARAATLGKLDGEITREEALAHARLIVHLSPHPVAADLENGFGDSPETAAETIRLAAGADVLFAPGLPDLAAVRTVCSALAKPVNFMVGMRGRSFALADLVAAGVRRVSLSTSLYRAAQALARN